MIIGIDMSGNRVAVVIYTAFYGVNLHLIQILLNRNQERPLQHIGGNLYLPGIQIRTGLLIFVILRLSAMRISSTPLTFLQPVLIDFSAIAVRRPTV